MCAYVSARYIRQMSGGLSYRAWDSIATAGLVSLGIAIGSVLLSLPLAVLIAPWLFFLGTLAILWGAIGRVVKRRRDFRAAEAQAAQELDRLERRSRRRATRKQSTQRND